MDKLKPCPFCGNDKKLAIIELGSWFVLCHNCFCYGPHEMIRQQAIEKRNDRKGTLDDEGD